MYGVFGMAIAIAATLMSSVVDAYAFMIGALVIGGAIGAFMAGRVAMTAMPELVALLHSFVGLAAVLVGVAAFLSGHTGTVALVEIWVDIAIGAITFTGSVIAFFKLKGTLSGKATLLPLRHFINLAFLAAIIGLAVPFVTSHDIMHAIPYLCGMMIVAALLGMHLVLAIGGADMPVVVSMLNSYSGWTASAAGFMLSNDLLIVTGALVGSSGAILSLIMCRAMNRSILSVIFGGFGAKPAAKSSGDSAAVPEGEVTEIDVESTANALKSAKSVVVVPGYGMAVARAQHVVKDMTDILKKQNTEVRFAIHPVAGRLPGHMNVLLAEASVPYPIVLEMDEINEDFAKTDVVLVIGANDIVNPGALTDESSPIYGMPVLEVWDAKLVVVMKRSRNPGYAGVDNPLFYKESTSMLFGDALDSMKAIVSKLG